MVYSYKGMSNLGENRGHCASTMPQCMGTKATLSQGFLGPMMSHADLAPGDHGGSSIQSSGKNSAQTGSCERQIYRSRAASTLCPTDWTALILGIIYADHINLNLCINFAGSRSAQ